uniref:Conotoxin Im3.1 n=2 Tax=Conus TaxID=6490 RepID=CM31_CONIM|nr:RecName: Full=Conotoxin Im3.1; AltName: Full=Conopeptide im012; Flags: Precursor [Conus imperialis]AME17670.1 conopeptide im012 [Conus imperialis]
MMSTLVVLLTICLLMLPLTARQLDADQLADQLAERMEDISADQNRWFDPVKRCCMRPICMCPCCVNG